MTDQAPLSAGFIYQVARTYRLNESEMQAAMQEHRELKTFLAMFRTAVEMSDEPNPDFIATLTRIIRHMDSMSAIMTRLQSVAKQASAVIGEYEV